LNSDREFQKPPKALGGFFVRKLYKLRAALISSLKKRDFFDGSDTIIWPPFVTIYWPGGIEVVCH
jgi:hypothetical protein|tara:strand:- start:478 stop:672 length:195 start_codon:yes stop_codon:yes gene_type:complete